MKKNILITYCFLIFIMVSCFKKTEYGQPNTNLNSIEKDFMKWWVYHNNNIKLSSNFKAISNSSTLISKEVFLKELISGGFIPIKLISKDNSTYYKLFKLNRSANKDIKNTIITVSSRAYKHFEMEGRNFPNFKFIDLNGMEYNNENTKSKIVVLKCWFINCKPCIEEFPELNNLVKKNKENKDIIFISLAFDSKENLKQFLKKKPFEYTIIPNQEEFMRKILKIDLYPTHFIIDRKGKINKVVNTAEEMILSLKSLRVLTEKLKKMPPPPSSKSKE